jgi:ADP-heptose:LPS heptosyltransferase
VNNRVLRELIRICHGNQPVFFPYQIDLKPGEETALPVLDSTVCFGVQTHLTGMRTKQWGIQNWRRYLELLLQLQPEIQVLLFDSSPEVEQLRLDPRILTTHGLNIFQSIRLAEKMSCFVSIDSWTKYVAAWSGIPQLIVVPDQRPEYPHLTAERLVRREFAGIYGRKMNSFLGLEQVRRRAVLTLPSMDQLTPGDLIKKTAQLRAAASTR